MVTTMVQFAVSGRVYVFEKSRASQEIRKIVVGIKKAAPLKEADTKNIQRNYTMFKVESARLFDKYKLRLRMMLAGYQSVADHPWDKLPDDEILRLVAQYRQHAGEKRNVFYLGVALYGLQVLRRRDKPAASKERVISDD